MEEVWNEIIFKVPPNPNLTVILWSDGGGEAKDVPSVMDMQKTPPRQLILPTFPAPLSSCWNMETLPSF